MAGFGDDRHASGLLAVPGGHRSSDQLRVDIRYTCSVKGSAFKSIANERLGVDHRVQFQASRW